VLLAVIVFVLAGCNGNTIPATNVSTNSATLHADVAWLQGDSGYYWWEYSNDGGATWTESPTPQEGGHIQFGPLPSNGSDTIGRNVTGLTPGSHYIFRLAEDDNGNGIWHADHDGPCEYLGVDDPCTNYDAFDTPSGPLTTKDQCKKGGWKQFSFKNQGRCIRLVKHGPKK
jgi:hypothetical protein